MNRLETQWQRLYRPGRGLVVQVTGAAAWAALRPVWQGVQADLELPAPAIAVNGTDGYQLWFSLPDAAPVAQVSAFEAVLRRRYLAGVAAERVRIELPAAPALPAAAPGAERWAAFVTPDLATLFADEPWLDIAPGVEAQADLLSRLQVMQVADLQRVSQDAPAAKSDGLAPNAAAANAATANAAAANGPHTDPRRFLLDVMNDTAVDLHLRVEAAKALLPYVEAQRAG